jgi:hypothetical protein
MMKQYETPQCWASPLDLEAAFLNGASAGGFPVDPINPFGGGSNSVLEEDEAYE